MVVAINARFIPKIEQGPIAREASYSYLPSDRYGKSPIVSNLVEKFHGYATVGDQAERSGAQHRRIKKMENVLLKSVSQLGRGKIIILVFPWKSVPARRKGIIPVLNLYREFKGRINFKITYNRQNLPDKRFTFWKLVLMKRILPTLLLVSLLVSCTKDDLVDSALQQYLDSFQEEAKKRGFRVNYETKKIEAHLELHEDNSNLGWCTYNSDRPNYITINSFYWDVLSPLEKEKLIFHELGHCVLNRPHYDVTRIDGRCKSIMHSGQSCSDDYNEGNRSRYLDELFFR